MSPHLQASRLTRRAPVYWRHHAIVKSSRLREIHVEMRCYIPYRNHESRHKTHSVALFFVPYWYAINKLLSRKKALKIKQFFSFSLSFVITLNFVWLNLYRKMLSTKNNEKAFYRTKRNIKSKTKRFLISLWNIK